jgi:hypothetical protein
MMKILAATMLFAQMISTGNHRKIFPAAGASIAYIANATGQLGAVPTPVTTSTSLNVVVGDKLIVFCKTGGGNNTLTVTDTAGNTFSKGTHQNDAVIGNTDMFYSVVATSNAADYFTCNSSNSANFSALIALQYRGGATSGIADVLLNAAATSGVWTSSAFSTATAQELVVQCMATDGTPTGGTIGGATANVRVAGSSTTPACQDYIFTSTQTLITATYTITGTGDYNGQLGAFK